MTDGDVLGLIPARGGSKGVPRKNIRLLGGRPLIGYTIEAARQSETVSSTVVSTDDDEIAEVATNEGAEVPFRRPDSLAADESPTEPVIDHALSVLSERGEQFEDIILLQPTSPLRTAAHIDEAYERFDDPEHDSVISVYPTREVRWERGPNGARPVDDSEKPARRQDRDPKYVTNGALYITAIQRFLEMNSLTSGRTVLYEMDEVESLDIDTTFDLWLAEQILGDWYDD